MTGLYHSDIVYDIRWIQNFLKEKHKMETTETKPLTKHIQTAVNAIQKQIDKYEKQRLQLLSKAGQLEQQAETITDSIEGLSQQISKLKEG